jgi:hypothetical protein
MTDRREYYKKYNEEHNEQRKHYNAERYKMSKEELLAKDQG